MSFIFKLVEINMNDSTKILFHLCISYLLEISIILINCIYTITFDHTFQSYLMTIIVYSFMSFVHKYTIYRSINKYNSITLLTNYMSVLCIFILYLPEFKHLKFNEIN